MKVARDRPESPTKPTPPLRAARVSKRANASAGLHPIRDRLRTRRVRDFQRSAQTRLLYCTRP